MTNAAIAIKPLSPELLPDFLAFFDGSAFNAHRCKRGRGIARELLAAACTGLRRQGLRIAEANPRTTSSSDAENHFGPLSLYLSAGFALHREDPDGSVSVRLAL